MFISDERCAGSEQCLSARKFPLRFSHSSFVIGLALCLSFLGSDLLCCCWGEPLRQQRPSQPSAKRDHMPRAPHWKIKMAQAGYKHDGSCSVPATDAFTRRPPSLVIQSFCILEQPPTSATHPGRHSRSCRLPTTAAVIRWRRRPSTLRASQSPHSTCASPARPSSPSSL